MIKEAADKVIAKKDLTAQEMRAAMEEIMSGSCATEDIVLFLTGLNKKGESIEELTAAARVMREHALKIKAPTADILDTCGTGGDKKSTFNISTAAAFVAAGCGITVAKHGNRSVSSKSGSADCLEALGINLEMSQERIEQCLRDVGMAFLFAQRMHPAMKYAMPARKQIGAKTIFNILGPLTNPAGASHQLIGVYAEGLVEKVARVLVNLGTKHGLVVCGEGGLDELSTQGETFICEATAGGLRSFKVKPEEFGIKRAGIDEIAGKDAAYNAQLLQEVLEGKPGPIRDIVLLNSAAAISAADHAGSIKAAIKLAEEAIDSGSALAKLKALQEFSKKEDARRA